jgi:hypothetical protein
VSTFCGAYVVGDERFDAVAEASGGLAEWDPEAKPSGGTGVAAVVGTERAPPGGLAGSLQGPVPVP